MGRLTNTDFIRSSLFLSLQRLCGFYLFFLVSPEGFGEGPGPVRKAPGTRFQVNCPEHISVSTDLSIMGPVLLADGLGRQSIELAHALQRWCRVEVLPTRGSAQDIASLFQLRSRRSIPLGKTLIYQDDLYRWPNPHTPPPVNQIRVAYSMFESTRIPAQWVTTLNFCFDAVIVPDPFLISVYQQSGVKIPIFVIPLGLDLQPFLQSPLHTAAGKPMVFSNFSAIHQRKNHRKLIQAFSKALGNNPEACLKINARAVERDIYQNLLDELKSLNLNNVFISIQTRGAKSYLEEFQKTDCYISISSGEGFSIQPREAMCLGIPCIVTDNTGQSTICASGLVEKVLSSQEKPAQYPCLASQLHGEDVGYQFDCEVEEVARAIRRVFDCYQDYLSHGPDMRKWASQYDYTEAGPAENFLALINPQNIILSDDNRTHGGKIYTNNENFFKKLRSIHKR